MLYEHVPRYRLSWKRKHELDAEIVSMRSEVEFLLERAGNGIDLSNMLFSMPHNGIFYRWGKEKSEADRAYLTRTDLYKRCVDRIEKLHRKIERRMS